ncbi:MAG: TRAP transporter substrate-binding protein DctP [Spirochaetales bacterium]|nr:TRAP transporter substrate-binding protein DctP [Spirochaetales bacterium]
MRRYANLLLVCALFIAGIANLWAGGGQDSVSGPVTLRFSHGMAADGTFGQAALRFSEAVSQKTGGRYKVDVYHNAQLGSERDTVEACQMGNLDFAVVNQAVLANFIPEISALDLPYIIESKEHADAVFNGDVGKYYLDRLERVGLAGLTYFESGFRNLTNNRRPINSVTDVRGLRIRVMENRIHQEAWRTLGADPVPMSWGDAYTAMQQNAIDGQENPTVVAEQNHVGEVNKHIAITEHAYTTCFLIMSPKTWSGISAADQKLFLEAAQEAAKYNSEASRSLEAASLAKMQQQGMSVTRPDKRAFITATSPVREKFKSEFAEQIALIEKARP